MSMGPGASTGGVGPQLRLDMADSQEFRRQADVTHRVPWRERDLRLIRRRL